MSEAKIGKHLSAEHIRNVSLALKGRIVSAETKRKISKALMGHYQSAETKRKISKAGKGKLTGEKHPMFGKHHSKESIKKNAEAHRGNKASEETRAKLREKRKLQVMPKQDTVPEKMMQNALMLENIEFKKHKPFKVGKTYHQVDIFIEPNICVEVDGFYFHSWPKNRERDAQIDEALKSQGYQVIRCVVHGKSRYFDVKPHIQKIKQVILQQKILI